VARKKSWPCHSLAIRNQKGDTMRQSRSAVLLLVGLLWIFHGKGTAQNAPAQSSVPRHALSLDNGNSGQRMTTTVGQPIQITLQTIGPGQYVSPQISSPAIRFVSAGFAETQNPGGPRQIYRFRGRGAYHYPAWGQGQGHNSGWRREPVQRSNPSFCGHDSRSRATKTVKPYALTGWWV